MAHDHGRKKYLQILIDPNRYELMEQLADEAGFSKVRADGVKKVQTSAWVREALYKYTADCCDDSLYKVAEAKDQAIWQESVRRRVEGRTKTK